VALFKKSGGGFLNGVEGVINSLTFKTKEFISKKTKQPYSKLSAEILVTPDGAEEPVQQFVDAGFFYPDNMAISEDGKTLMGIDDDANVVELDETPLRDDTEFAKLILSLVEAGFPEELLGIGVNYSPVEGVRVRFKRVVDEEGTKTLGKRKSKDGKKEYNRDFLLIDALLAMPEAGAKGAKGAKKTAAPKAAAKTAGAKAGAKKTAPVANDTDRADEVVTAMLADAKDGVIERKSIGSVFVRYALKNGVTQEDRKVIQAQLTSEEYLTDAQERGVLVLTDTQIAAAA
jgi:GrpB-like predicted nucleotidyltransferase (UPF0157 family)